MDLRQFREAIGLTLEQMAHDLGPIDSVGGLISKGTLSKIERGKLVPRGDVMLRISVWAEEERKRRRLPISYRISWEHLLESGPGAHPC